MNVLACSDGHEAADRAVAFASKFLSHADTATLLGIVEHPSDESNLREALEREAKILRSAEAKVSITVRHGLPLVQIREESAKARFDWVVIGAVRRTGCPFALSAKAYHLIKELAPPVMAVMGDGTPAGRILVCASGATADDERLRLVGVLATVGQMKVTLLHVLAPPPPIYAELAERDVNEMLRSNSRLGQSLRREIQKLEALGVSVDVKLRHGLVAREILREAREGNCDLIVAGSAPTGGALQTYVMGDITSEIVNGAEGAVLVVRGKEASPQSMTLAERIRRWWRGRGARSAALPNP